MAFEKDRIDRLNQALYSRNKSLVPEETRSQVHGEEPEVPTSWGTRPSFAYTPEDPTVNNSFFNKFLIVSGIFFVLALGAAVFIFYGGLNMISSNNVDIKVTAPSVVASGETVDLALSVTNQNRTDLEDVALYIDYPDGVKSTDVKNIPLSYDKIDLGTITNGGNKDYSFRALFFGEKGATKTLTFKIEYRVKGSNAVFSKEKTYDVQIGSSPLLVDVSYPKEINSGQTVTLSIDVTSNSNVVMQNTLVKVEYPYGFTYTSSNIKPIQDSLWNIGDLKSGDKKTLTIQGKLVGQDMEDRAFRISTGLPKDQTMKDIDTALATDEATIGIRKSFYSLSVDSGSTPGIGNAVPVTISWQNTLPEKIVNNQVTATLSGDILDRASVRASDSGYYDSGAMTVTWDRSTSPLLAEIAPGDSGRVTLSLASLKNNSIYRSIRNPHIDVQVTMEGARSGDGSSVSSTENISIKLPTTLALSARSYRSVGPLSNTGSVPPKVERETTYTVTWTLTNTTNDLSGGTVTATLPVGVMWKGEISPTSERLAFNPDTRQVVWNVGTISAGAGFSNSPKEVSFKVGITPNITMAGQAVTLTSEVSATADDAFASTTASVSTSGVTTRFSDPGFKSGEDVVVK